MREGWEIPDELKPGIVNKLLAIVAQGEDRDAIAASKVLVAIEIAKIKAQADDDRRLAAENEQRLRLLEIARRLPAEELTGLLESSGGDPVDGTVLEPDDASKADDRGG